MMQAMPDDLWRDFPKTATEFEARFATEEDCRAYWMEASEANRKALRAFLSPETTVWQYTHGVSDTTLVSPDGLSLDNFYLARPGAAELPEDLESGGAQPLDRAELGLVCERPGRTVFKSRVDRRHRGFDLLLIGIAVADH